MSHFKSYFTSISPCNLLTRSISCQSRKNWKNTTSWKVTTGWLVDIMMIFNKFPSTTAAQSRSTYHKSVKFCGHPKSIIKLTLNEPAKSWAANHFAWWLRTSSVYSSSSLLFILIEPFSSLMESCGANQNMLKWKPSQHSSQQINKATLRVTKMIFWSTYH